MLVHKKEPWMIDLHHYVFEWEDIDGTWIREEAWSDSTKEVMNELATIAHYFGTGRYRFFGDLLYGSGMWRDEQGLLHITRDVWRNYGNDYKGTFDDIYGDHPELKGRKTLMPPLSYGYATCLLIEGGGFVVEAA